MATYQCHKKVKAAKITAVASDSVSFDKDGIEMEVWFGPEWLAKHKPEVGGYLVVYEDGYNSYSPAKAFEEGYTVLE